MVRLIPEFALGTISFTMIHKAASYFLPDHNNEARRNAYPSGLHQ
jgi:hypothetical protein